MCYVLYFNFKLVVNENKPKLNPNITYRFSNIAIII